MTIEESIHVSFDESNVFSPRKDVLDDALDFLEEMHTHERNLNSTPPLLKISEATCPTQ